VQLEQAVINYAIDKLIDKGFNLMTVPNMVSGRIAAGAGFAPKSDKESNEYFIENEDLMMIGTAEAHQNLTKNQTSTSSKTKI
jgi:seryl-tRNA synthetase